ncbi:ATP-binding protein [Nonomuraea helvata]|uniref:ATP-binding protein n=1 Tax=Nonomuraea helvata TaxID=37484 RepID=A0ABV5RTN3_9ACTN
MAEPVAVLGRRLLAARKRTFVGREEELAVFEAALRIGGRVLFVHGPGGVGKSALLCRFAQEAAGRPVTKLDGHALGPSPAAFESAARPVLDGERAVLLIDTLEQIQSLENWLREHFLPPAGRRARRRGRTQLPGSAVAGRSRLVGHVADHAAALRLAAKVDGVESVVAMRFWMDRQPQAYRVYRRTATGGAEWLPPALSQVRPGKTRVLGDSEYALFSHDWRGLARPGVARTGADGRAAQGCSRGAGA